MTVSSITKTEEGIFRWVYEVNLYKNPSIIILVGKVLAISLGIVLLFLVALLAIEGDLSLEELGNLLLVFGGIAAVLFVISIIGYLVYAAVMGGRYCVLFEMDEEGITHTQLASQVKKAKVLAVLVALAGVAAGRPSVSGSGILAGSRFSKRSRWRSVKTVEPLPTRNLINVGEKLHQNQIYVEQEDFDFVLGFIRDHVAAAQTGRTQKRAPKKPS
jgi:hypothetical protein